MVKPDMDSIEQLIRAGRTCVLATTGPDGPHTSLMAYVAAPGCRSLYLVTPRRTLKFQNMVEHPGVSMLIDTRCIDPLENVRALTVTGTAAEVIDAGARKTVRELFAAKHPKLADFIDAADSVFVVVSIHSFQLLNGIRKSGFIRVDESDESIAKIGGDA